MIRFGLSVRFQTSALPVQSRLVFGVVVVVLGFTSGSLYSLLAGSIGNLLRGNLKFLRAQRYFAGSVYIGLGVTTALTGTRQK